MVLLFSWLEFGIFAAKAYEFEPRFRGHVEEQIHQVRDSGNARVQEGWLSGPSDICL